jgi:hypothetical protein
MGCCNCLAGIVRSFHDAYISDGDESGHPAIVTDKLSLDGNRLKQPAWCRRAFKTTQLCALNFTQGL